VVDLPCRRCRSRRPSSHRESLANLGRTRMSQTNVDRLSSWLMAQAQTMIDLFTEVRGRAPASRKELAQFLDEECAAGRILDGPIQPTAGALLKIAKYGRLT
jgi:hypothetical protein